MSDEIVEGFEHHTGVHCGSTAMADLLRHAGVELSEAMVFGLGSGLASYYLESEHMSPSRQILGRHFRLEENCAEALGLELRAHFEGDNAAAWQGVRAAIERDQPVLVQCDLCELPYWQTKTPFNGHKIAVVGFNDAAGEALVADTHFEGLQRVSLNELEAARASTAPPSMGNQNAWWTLEAGRLDGDGLDGGGLDGGTPRELAEAIPFALVRNAEQMENDTSGFGGLDALEQFAAEVSSWRDLDDASWAYRFAYQCIEKRGTGGGNFRALYRDYLSEAGEHVPSILRNQYAVSMARTASAWSTLARYLEAMSRFVSADGVDDSDRPDEDPTHHLESMAEAVFQFESTFWDRILLS
jgi:hypothetical protein